MAAIRNHADGELLRRYRAGQFDEVWREIGGVDEIDGEFRQEVLEVSKETMRRVARNADVLAEAFERIGWRSFFRPMRSKAATKGSQAAKRLHAIFDCPPPPTLVAFWEVVGGINLWPDPDMLDELPDLGFDPLAFICEPLTIFDDDYIANVYLEEIEVDLRDDDSPRKEIDLTPGYEASWGIAGAGGNYVELPSRAPDVVLHDHRCNLPFVSFLRRAFDWAGMPGDPKFRDHPDVMKFVRQFGADLEPF